MGSTGRRHRRVVVLRPWIASAFLAAVLGCSGADAPAPAWTHSGIIGGEETTGWPAVGAYLIGGQAGLCTGTLVAPDVVLTAAHCEVLGNDADQFFLGPSIFEAGETIAVVSTDSHPYYNAETKEHDLAILRLEQPVEIEPMALNLAAVDDSWFGTVLHAVGYGNADVYNGEILGTKRETDLDFSDWSDSLIWHESEGHNTCSGDSGGPIFVQQGPDWVVAGVASFVYPASEGEDYCSGGGGNARVDIDLEFLSDHVEGLPVGDDDDDDDDGQSFLEEDDQGCKSSVAASTSGTALGALLLLAGALLRRRTAAGS